MNVQTHARQGSVPWTTRPWEKTPRKISHRGPIQKHNASRSPSTAEAQGLLLGFCVCSGLAHACGTGLELCSPACREQPVRGKTTMYWYTIYIPWIYTTYIPRTSIIPHSDDASDDGCIMDDVLCIPRTSIIRHSDDVLMLDDVGWCIMDEALWWCIILI